MSTVYILGAGCTRNYQASNEYGLESPLDEDFFKICNTILLKKLELTNAFSELIKHLDFLFGLKLVSEQGSKRFSLETVTTILDLESRGKSRQYIDSLTNLICITFDIVLKGPTCPLHSELVKRLKPRDVLISYNYDLVMDNALMEGKNLDQNIYGLNFDRKHDIDWRPCEKEVVETHLLKLHGSMNWLKCSRCGALLIYKGKKAVADLSYQLIGLGTAGSELSCPICQSKELNTVLIPPLLAKELYGEEFRYPWYLAERSIVSADRIVVIGYSLPPTDFYSEFLLRKAMSERFRAKPTLRVVSKDTKKVPERFETILGVKSTGNYRNLKEYLEKTTD